jgi:hypothetical protein
MRSAGRYRLDGSPYPDGLEGLFQWARDLEDHRGRIVRQEITWNGLFVSTVWIGLDHRFGDGPPLIFETMVFDRIGDRGADGLEMNRYSTLAEAECGHYLIRDRVASLRYTLRYWWRQVLEHVREEADE